MRKTAVGVTPPPRTTKPDRRAHRDRLSPGRLRARKQIRPRPGDAGRAHWPGVTDRGPTPRDAGRPRRPARTARGSGATGEGSGVLHEVRGFVQYAQPLASTPPPSFSRPARGGGRPEPMMRQCHLTPVQEEDMSQAGQGGKTTAPTPDSITPAAECPHSGHQRARRRGARREPLEFHGFFSGCEVGAVFMSAAWTPQRASGFRGRATRVATRRRLRAGPGARRLRPGAGGRTARQRTPRPG